MYKHRGTYNGKGSVLIVTVFVTEAELDGVSNFTVMRGIEGVANDGSGNGSA